MYEFHYHKAFSINEVKEKISSLNDAKIMVDGMTFLHPSTMKQQQYKFAAP